MELPITTDGDPHARFDHLSKQRKMLEPHVFRAPRRLMQMGLERQAHESTNDFDLISNGHGICCPFPGERKALAFASDDPNTRAESATSMPFRKHLFAPFLPI